MMAGKNAFRYFKYGSFRIQSLSVKDGKFSIRGTNAEFSVQQDRE